MRSITPLAWVILFALITLNGAIWHAITQQDQRVLTVSFLDVGQGDSILIESPTGTQMLIDGGPDRSVMRQLPKGMGPLDRSIDILIATHPDKDHIAGLTDVFSRYRIGTYVEPGIPSDSSYAESLATASQNEKGLQQIVGRRGMRMHLGGGAYADILYPDRDVSGGETNDGSIIVRVVYGETEFMLSGDAPSSVEDWVVALSGSGSIQSDVLKAGHHGSRTSTDSLWLEKVDPQYVVVSAGKGNSYGHPHEEVLSRIAESGAEVFSTAQEGNITFVSDGRQLIRR